MKPLENWPLPQPQRIVAVTGHRPDKLGGYGNARAEILLNTFAQEIVFRWSPDCIITGMAQGWDLAIARQAHCCSIPFVAAIPSPCQTNKWPIASRDIYYRLLQFATVRHYINETNYFDTNDYQRRNAWMVDRCHVLIALWNGSTGGTANCVHYAERKGVQVVNVWKDWERWLS